MYKISCFTYAKSQDKKLERRDFLLSERLRQLTSIKAGGLLLGLLALVPMVGLVLPDAPLFYQSGYFSGLVLLLCLQSLFCMVRRWSSWKVSWRGRGILMVHLALPFLAIGAFGGNHYGYQYQTLLPPGAVYSIPGEPLALRLEQFNTEYYQDGSVSDWISQIALVKDGIEVAQGTVKVNAPFHYEGIYIYQGFYGTGVGVQYQGAAEPSWQQGYIVFGEKLTLSGSGKLELEPLAYVKDQELRILYRLYQDGQVVDVAAVSAEETVVLPEGLGRLRFIGPVYFSGLQIKKDPGLPFVWIGCLLVSIGIILGVYNRQSFGWESKERKGV